MTHHGQQLKKAIRVLGMSQQLAADTLKVSRVTLSNYLHRDELPINVLQEIKTKLNIDLQNVNVNPEYEQIKSTLIKQGYADTPPKVSKTQAELLELSNASYITASFELLVELLAVAKNEPLEAVKVRASKLVHEKGRKLEDFLNATLA